MGTRLVSGESGGRHRHNWHIALIAASLCAASAGCGGSETGVDGAKCLRTEWHATIQVDPFGGWPGSQSPDAGMSQEQRKWSTTGIVTQSAADSIVVDSCAPDANCAPMPSKISVQAPSLKLSIPVGSIVSASYLGAGGAQATYAGGSGQLLIESVGAWGGKQDPAGDGKLYVAAVDGWHEAPAGAPFSVGVEDLTCSGHGTSSPGSTYLPVGDYALGFSTPRDTHITVQMGQTKPFIIGGQKLRASNLRSFQSDATDAHWDWAYWIAP